MAATSTVRIIVSATAAGAVAAFSRIRAAASAMAAHVSSRVRRVANAVSGAGSSLAKMAGSVGASIAPYAVLAGKILLVVSALLTLTGVAGNVLGIIQLAAPAAVAAAAGMVVFKMSLSGVSDALKAGIDGDVEKLNAALKKLSPSAKSAVLTLLDLRKEWKSVQQATQEAFFKGFREDAIAVSRALQPIAQTWLPKIAQAFGAARFAIAGVFTQAAQSGQLDRIMAGVTGFFQNLALVVQPLGKAFLDVAEVAAPKFAELGKIIANLAASFRDWIAGAKEGGKLQEWLDKAWETFGKLWQIAKNLGAVLAALFQGSSDSADGFLDKLVRVTGKMAEWAKGEDAQKIIGWLAKIITWILACEPAFEVVLGWIKFLITFWGALFTAAKGAWDGIVSAFAWAIGQLMNGFGMLINGAAAAFGWMPGIGDKLKAAAAAFNRFKDEVNVYLNGIKKTVDITVTYRARWIGNHLVSGSQQSGEYSSGIGGRASGGIASRLTWVGERGPELVDFSQGRVYNSGASRNMAMAPAGGGAGNMTVNLYVQGSIRSDRELVALIRNEFQRGGLRGVATR